MILIPATLHKLGRSLMSDSLSLLRKLGRDTAGLLVAFLVMFFAFYGIPGTGFYGLRATDPGATVDGLGNLFVAMQVVIIGLACASAAGVICWLLFGMLGRRKSEELCAVAWQGLATVFLYRFTWFAIFYLLFSRSV